ncbi:hypothetical protein OIDMADRAFT_20605 [Oidiodendron maius Zn]|uniref:Uncharacterized protein n=1 Tax=Oidiodendron maius (strain Zn) TaxID=913774 RepID=A0A0C3H2B7_OIDMZ|nr:hypothetical protein OIDMADRAFT_20605 [Oidiodendron maius Zn]
MLPMSPTVVGFDLKVRTNKYNSSDSLDRTLSGSGRNFKKPQFSPTTRAESLEIGISLLNCQTESYEE